ncbi:Aspartyl/glutamyl-tRNA(Asn/Gln) amidotransferase subunit C [bioreactor metagenome]|uniref:Aspartyl/glutamyl-tRNA(Asn/Gln) amidotransferase subunit C n=3 Tax=root TaxID=1 RepID=A0A098B6U8_DESHA|nr:aspartyl/glutamyl-tRNA(Asn/Gln) amidotransferase, C subunit [Desulfitobacterium hafniense DP7]CDX04077.1 Aspartyl/glutamyl-tRNA(Asn/Gln) amidotransferase subunit C [Desulfitobacterium hafniense]
MVNEVKISREEVEHVAFLARLELTEEELVTNTEQLNSILDYAAMLEKLNTDDIKPTAHAVPLHNVLREDQVKPSMAREKVLANAPDAQDGFFKVPRIV